MALPAMFVALCVAGGDSPVIERIRARSQALLETARAEDALKHQVIARRVVPGTGAQTKTLDLFYSVVDDPPAKDGTPRSHVELDRSVLEWNVAAQSFHTELVFEKGQLVFGYESSALVDCGGGERRFYFDKGTLVRVRVSPQPDCTEPKATTRDSGFTRDDLSSARGMQGEADGVKDWFKRIEAL